ncbi:hypothetical protein [Paludibacterium sp. B53371]|uniref:hypothetical protein n=1 Tax=Paludibacterium sp. B53371 TaxID=2806263 RepID=UPI001C041DA7|nr:hypothetical protein [Paludibacterium sp. B53371]
MNQQTISQAAEKAMQVTLSETAQLSNEDASEYLSAVATTAISMLRSIDGESFVYGFLRSALASLGQEVGVAENPFGGTAGIAVQVGARQIDPNQIHSLQELREALHQANEQLLDRDIQLVNQKAVLQRVLRDIAPILLAHASGNADQVKGLLDAFCTRHVLIKKPDSQLH